MCISPRQITRTLTRFLGIVLPLLALLCPAHAAVEVKPGKGIADLERALVFSNARGATLAETLRLYREGGMAPELRISPHETNYAPEAWAAVDIVNTGIVDGRPADRFAVVLDLPLASGVDIYLVRSGGLTENLLNYSLFGQFVAEEHSVTRLRTPVFDIAPRETVTLLIRFDIGPFRSFRLSLETPQELEASTFAAGVGYTAFYAFALACLVFFFGFHLALKNWIGVFYAVLFLVALGLVAFVDGILFRFLYPDHPQWQSAVGFFLLYGLSASGFLVAGRSVAGDGRQTRLSVGLALLSLLSVGGFVAALLSPGTYAATFAYVLLVAMFAAVLVTAIVFRRRDRAIHIGSLVTSGVFMLAAFAVVIVVLTGWGGDILLASDALKAVFAFMLIATMTNLTVDLVLLRRRHRQAVEAQMEALEAEARRSRELLETEQNYRQARDLASLRQRQLATASHDLKQPLMSLRMTFDTLADRMEPKMRDRLKEAFDYMESLSQGYLDETAPPDDETHPVSGPEGMAAGEEAEAYRLSIILGTVHQMFHEEAISRGLELRMVDSSLSVRVAPIVLMRIMSNLVANAVKYTQRGRVLVGVRRSRDSAVLCVADTGPGMSEDELARFREAYNKGEGSDGHGLGLAVCFDLARQHGLDLAVRPETGRGTIFRLTVPALRESPEPTAD